MKQCDDSGRCYECDVLTGGDPNHECDFLDLRDHWEKRHDWEETPPDELLKRMGFGSSEQWFTRSIRNLHVAPSLVGKDKRGMGYHLKEIAKGKLGELSKIEEELREAEDAEDQDCKVMVLVELSDMLGAIEAYLEKHFPDFRLEDLKKMSDITRRAFRTGARKDYEA